jgi:hypothetical protein
VTVPAVVNFDNVAITTADEVALLGDYSDRGYISDPCHGLRRCGETQLVVIATHEGELKRFVGTETSQKLVGQRNLADIDCGTDAAGIKHFPEVPDEPIGYIDCGSGIA